MNNRSHRQRHPSTGRVAGSFAIPLLVIVVMGALWHRDDVSATAQETPLPDSARSRDAGGILLVVGASGTKQYGEQFAKWAEQWEAVGRKSEVPVKSIGRSERGAKTDREQLAELIANVKPEGSAPLWLVMIGHGTFAQNVAKFNLRGPDVSATELAQWLSVIKRPLVVVNCASASGPFVNRLSGPNRIVVTATKSGVEQNYARFGDFFARAIASPDSDLDHDDEVSVHEAFLRASAEVQSFYDGEGRLATEHALIDDNADGRGTPASMFRGVRAIVEAKDGRQLDGANASRVTLSPSGTRLNFTEQELETRAEIESALDKLRARKQDFSEQEYDNALEPLMLRLARIYQAAERRAARASAE